MTIWYFPNFAYRVPVTITKTGDVITAVAGAEESLPTIYDLEGGFDPGSELSLEVYGGHDPGSLLNMLAGGFDPGSELSLELYGGFDPGSNLWDETTLEIMGVTV